MSDRSDLNQSNNRYKLDEISEHHQIGINTLRYHIKKLQTLFLDVPRDRYNRYLFDEVQQSRLLSVHNLKKQGMSYEYIKDQFDANHTTPNRHAVTEQLISVTSSNSFDEDMNNRLEQLEKFKTTANKINKAMCENLKQLHKILKEQNAKIDSLEERVALLVELHTENLLKKGLISIIDSDESSWPGDI